MTCSEVANDNIGAAVGHRKIGECLCELSDFEGALKHQRKFLKVNCLAIKTFPLKDLYKKISSTCLVQQRSQHELRSSHTIKVLLIIKNYP